MPSVRACTVTEPSAFERVDVVPQHVDSQLEEKPEEKPKADAPKRATPAPSAPKPRTATPPAPAPPSPPRPAPRDEIVLSTEGPAYSGPSLPQRVFGRQFQL